MRVRRQEAQRRKTRSNSVTAGALSLVLLALPTLCARERTQGRQPIWSKKGVLFAAACSQKRAGDCEDSHIVSPDGKSEIEVTYTIAADDPGTKFVKLRVLSAGRLLGEILPMGTVANEIVWSPDSKAFFINGNNNGNGDYHVAVHRLDRPHLGPGKITADVDRDMVSSFPPCKARDAGEDCKRLMAHPEDYLGTAAIDWAGSSDKIVVMAEVTCSSSMGGIMCQVMGYEVEVPDGRILQRMNAKQFGEDWQHSMAWKFRVPDPPEYEQP